jgi:Mn2+/Fe2+ NRAMP family transporter
VRLVVFVMEQGIPDYGFLTKRARDEKQICWRFGRYYSIVPVLAGLIVAVGPPVAVLVWSKKAAVVTFFVSSVKMYSIGTQEQLGQFENSKIETGYLFTASPMQYYLTLKLLL